MKPFYEIASKTGKVATINLNYVKRFEPHGPNTDIWLEGDNNTGEVYYLAAIDYDDFRKAADRIMAQQ